MDAAREEKVRARAHAVWEREGRPEGGSDRHWAMAEAELLEEEGGRGAEALAAEAARTVHEAEAAGREAAPAAELAEAGRRGPESPMAEAARTADEAEREAASGRPLTPGKQMWRGGVA